MQDKSSSQTNLRSPLFVSAQATRQVLVWGEDPSAGLAGPWWALSPLAGRGSLAAAVGTDAVTTGRCLAQAIAGHPGWMATTLTTATR